MITLRSPRLMLTLLGISFFVGSLLSAVYAGVGKQQIDFMDRKTTGQTI